ncbi:trehalase family glycosidase [Nodosilinea sp. LEGE 07088]|uniref:trehalase family glycosidase n=1 Tax=Nodosilinea sp. LEGE 07088 TaxID=2777968 RepID=UPI0028BF3D44|nr:trehalase family glycosidase [Nodosilinea sp. LEGE 07088]
MKISALSPASELTPWQIRAVRAYIKTSWQTLSRSLSHVLEAAQDEKIEHTPGTPWPLYISAQEDRYTVEDALLAVLSPEEFAQIELRVLPADYDQITDHGLLYLPHDYVVPGGRFNEMYGWDSYFILLGLLRDQELLMAKGMVDQFIYQVQHYGTVLNANRTYMLNRSQPPVLSLMVMAVFQHTGDTDWLQSLLPVLERYYYYWMVPPHFSPVTGLSHYHALGHGPAPEVESSERDEAGRTHYDRVREYFREHPIDDYDVSLFYDAETDQLTELYYQGDRSMRESGFDITNRFGPFSADIIHYAPVCLNVLLYQMEQDMAEFYRMLGRSWEAEIWQTRAQHRHQLIDQYLWDDEAGLYFDYNPHTGQRRPYEFVTTFMPLWAGIASPHQARRVVDNLKKFEAEGGLLTSTHTSGNQWDAPFGWAPLQWFAVGGLARSGYTDDAHRVATKFVHMVVQEFEKTGTLLEKYDVERCSANVSDEIQFGYSSNEIGFGWTNGVVSEFLWMLEQRPQTWAEQAA